MRAGVVVGIGLAVGCGRIRFDELPGGDATATLDGFTRVVANGDETCATYRGALYCWGENASGQLGDGTTMPRPRPIAPHIPAGHVDDFTIGEHHACAIVDGTLTCWGTLASSPQDPQPVLAGLATAVSAGRDYTCAIVDGALACFGNNDHGQLGIGTMGPSEPVPQHVALPGVVAVEAGDDHVCALTAANAAYCWGHNDDGTLGCNSAASEKLTPTLVGAVTTLPRIAGWHACTLGDHLACWGRGLDGELGDGLDTSSIAPTAIALPFAITAVETGGGPVDFDATCAIRVDGTVACWGFGSFGRLGDVDEVNRNTPVAVAGLPVGIPAVGLALGYNHTCAMLADGTLWCWGRNGVGQLGRGTRTDHEFAPAPVTPP